MICDRTLISLPLFALAKPFRLFLLHPADARRVVVAEGFRGILLTTPALSPFPSVQNFHKTFTKPSENLQKTFRLSSPMPLTHDLAVG